MTLLPLVLPFAVLTLCALHDVTSFKIPNRYVAVLLLGWAPTMLLTGAPTQTLAASALIAGVVLLVGFGMFAASLIGAGDVKLLAATTLWIAPRDVAAFVLVTAVVGGLLGLTLLRVRSLPLPSFAHRAGWLVQLHGRERVMPYGVAIAAAAMLIMGQAATAA